MEVRGNVVSRDANGVLEFYVVDKGNPLLGICACCERCESPVEPGTDLCGRCVDEANASARSRVNGKYEEKIAFYRSYAEGRGLSWHFSNEEAVTMLQQSCALCGNGGGCIARLSQGNYELSQRFFSCVVSFFSSMKRPSNCFPACAVCNLVRLDYSPRDYAQMCKTIATHCGLVSQKWFFPDSFRDSPTPKTYRMYAQGTNRIMAMDKVGEALLMFFLAFSHGCQATFDTLLLQDCFYCGKRNDPPRHYNGVDRIDSSNRSYELCKRVFLSKFCFYSLIGNVVTCCKSCNSLKWSFSRDFFLQHARRVALFFDLDAPPLPRMPGDRNNPIVL